MFLLITLITFVKIIGRTKKFDIKYQGAFYPNQKEMDIQGLLWEEWDFCAKLREDQGRLRLWAFIFCIKYYRQGSITQQSQGCIQVKVEPKNAIVCGLISADIGPGLTG